MAPSRENVLDIAKTIGFDIPEHEVDDYTILLQKMAKTLEKVADMDDYQPKPDLETNPRRNIYFPKPEDNPLAAWAWRFEATSRNPSSSLLQNKTICLKDNICVVDVPCLLGTDTFTDWTPKMDATVVTRILSAGGTITGKAVCENLSRGAVSVTAATGPVHNPYARGYSVGGSSSGTAALVASGAVDMGIGCDQGGSIRIPASFAGLYGFKPTFGLVPYTGIVSNDASLDYVGPMTTTCLDTAILLESIAGVDGLDDRQIAGTPFPSSVPSYSQILLSSPQPLGLHGLKIGVLTEGLPHEIIDLNVLEKFNQAISIFRKLGAVVEEVSVPMHAEARTIYSVVSKMGNHMGMMGKATGRRQVGLTDLLEKKGLPYTSKVINKMNITSHESLLTATYAWIQHPSLHSKSVNLSRLLTSQYNAVLQTHPILLLPTTLHPASRFPAPDSSPLDQLTNSTVGLLENTCPFNLTGHPALAVPMGLVKARGADDGGGGEEGKQEVRVPCSFQVVGKWGDEVGVLRVGWEWEKEVGDWKKL